MHSTSTTGISARRLILLANEGEEPERIHSKAEGLEFKDEVDGVVDLTVRGTAVDIINVDEEGGGATHVECTERKSYLTRSLTDSVVGFNQYEKQRKKE